MSRHSGAIIDARVPAILHPLIQVYTHRLDQEMPGRVNAFYLEGSIALNGFNPRLSDVDFVALLNSKATTGDIDHLEKIHTEIEHQYPQWAMSGMYFQWEDLGCQDGGLQPFLHYQDGKLEWTYRFELSAVTWWILKHHGVVVFGPDVSELSYTVDMVALLHSQRENLHSYWSSWTRRPDRILALFTDWGVQWTVLGVLRQFYTLREHEIVSKVAAGEYALGCLPLQWHRIIREAIRLRQASAPSHYRTIIGRAIAAWWFLKYVIGVS
jgi:hypothetical protein